MHLFVAIALFSANESSLLYSKPILFGSLESLELVLVVITTHAVALCMTVVVCLSLST